MGQETVLEEIDSLGHLEQFIMEKRKIILIVGHGSRVAAANQEFEAFVERMHPYLPQASVKMGYVELAKPDLASALDEAASQADEIMVAPLFLLTAGHVKNDIPLAVHQARKRFPQVRFDVARPLGVHPHMVKLIAERVDAAHACLNKKKERTAVLMIGRGCSDPDANSDFCKLVRLFEETSAYARVYYAFIAVVRPTIEESLERLLIERPDAIILQPYLLFAGRLIQKLHELIEKYASLYPWVKMQVAQPLGEDPLVFELFKERIFEARWGNKPLPCDNCLFRVPIHTLDGKVGGLNALLYSIRHSFTHTQAMPHAHAHTAVKKHVLVCGNVDCVALGSIRLIEELRRLIKEHGMEEQIRVTQTSCLGYCGDGPAVAIYPDGIWYRRCDAKYAQELFSKHLMKGELIPEIVDQIM